MEKVNRGESLERDIYRGRDTKGVGERHTQEYILRELENERRKRERDTHPQGYILRELDNEGRKREERGREREREREREERVRERRYV